MDHQEPQNEVVEVQGGAEQQTETAPESGEPLVEGDEQTGEEVEEGNGQQQPKTPGNYIQVSLEKAPPFYAHLGRRLMENGQHEEIVITSLGNATNIAIGAASIMEREGAATITKVETDYYNSSRSKRRLPKITITLLKCENAPRLKEGEDEVAVDESAVAHQTVESSDAAQATAVNAAA